MMSMTGFGRSQVKNQQYQLTLEIKTVNHRFKDFRFRTPSTFNAIEMDFKRQLEEQLHRGSIDLTIHLKKSATNLLIEELDQDKVKSFISSFTKFYKNLSIEPTQFLRSEFLQDRESEDRQVLFDLAHQGLAKALTELLESRKREGDKLQKILSNHLDHYVQELEVVRQERANFEEITKNRLLEKFREWGQEIKIDEPRFMQEVIYYLERLDIDEEVNRISSHLHKLEQLLQAPGPVGRQIDFLLQELNRETNTIGSKSSSDKISSAVVQMKLQLEKLREQALNIE